MGKTESDCGWTRWGGYEAGREDCVSVAVWLFCGGEKASEEGELGKRSAPSGGRRWARGGSGEELATSS